MQETARIERNRSLLQQTNPVFRIKLAMMLAALQSDGWRPRLQEVWRSTEDQEADYAAGVSELEYGFHNCTAPDGSPDALAADVLDDDAPLQVRRPYVWALAKAAHRCGLETGITFGLPRAIQAALRAAIVDGDLAWVGKIGWDPDHVQIAGITIEAAQLGQRPLIGTTERIA